MRRISLMVCAVSAAAVLSCGCDMMRTLAGRPDSGEIAAKAAAIEEYEAAQEALKAQAEADELRRQAAIRQEADSLAAEESIRSRYSVIKPVSSNLLTNPEVLTSRYFLVLGSFREEANALRLKAKVEVKGYPAELFRYRNGTIAVVVRQSGTVKEFSELLGRAVKEDFYPQEAWLIVNE